MAATSVLETALMLAPPALGMASTVLQAFMQVRDRHRQPCTTLEHSPSEAASDDADAPASAQGGIRRQVLLVVAITEFTCEPAAEGRSDR